MLALQVAVFLGLALGWYGVIRWTAPGPDQKRRRLFMALAAVVLGLLIALYIAGSVVLEVKSNSADAESGQFGAGWLLLAALLSGPLLVLDAALFAGVGLMGRRTAVRAVGCPVAAVVAGSAVWIGLWILILGR